MDESRIPIDINYGKLLDWLIDRRHCQKMWQQPALIVRQKINEAIQDMPEVDEVTNLLQGTYINYFHCLRIVEILRNTESDSKNIFGYYSSQRMKDWQEIVRLYEKDGLYLGESAQLLARSVNYEIPAVKKQISRLKQLQKELTNQEAEYLTHAADLREKFVHGCRYRGIEGKSLKKELFDLAVDVPKTYASIASKCCRLVPAIDFYLAFVPFLLNSDSAKGQADLQLLSHIVGKGDTTVYEWKTGMSPEKVEVPTLTIADDDHGKEDKEEEIDWGEETDGIDFNISVDAAGDSTEIVSSDSDGVVRGDDARTLLDFTSTRNQIINECTELASFLAQRLNECSGDGHVLAASMFDSAPTKVQIDSSRVAEMLKDVESTVNELTDKRFTELTMIRASERYVERIANSLKILLENSDKLISRSKLMGEKVKDMEKEEKTLHPKVALIRAKTKELKIQLENEISKKYKNRPVNIMGEINSV